jgi:hypothetical protein
MSARAPFIAPTFHRATGSWNFSYPYASLNDQLKDAQGQWQKGAGDWKQQFNPQLQTVKNSPPGGLLAYFNNLFSKGGMPGGGGGGLPPPNTGGGTPPYNPGDPMPRPPQTNWNGDREPVVPYDPNRTSRTGTPTPWTPPGPQSRGGLLSPDLAKTTAMAGAPAPTAGTPTPPAPRDTGGMFDPGSGDTSAASMVSYFNSLPDDAAKANYVKAIDQYGLGKGGAANLGAGLQSALRQSMGGSQFDNWSATNIGAKPGVISAQGLPAWLAAALK